MASGIDFSWVWATGLITFALGITCGAAFTYLKLGNGRRRTTELQEQLDQLQQEFAASISKRPRSWSKQ